MAGIYHSLDAILGLSVEAKDLSFLHMAVRACIVFCAAILLARVADRRFMGHSACYDFMLGVILGAVLSRGINGQAAFFPTLGVSALLVLFHTAVGVATFHSHRLSRFVKGDPHVLVRDGQVDEAELRRNRITYDDLCENLRCHAGIGGVEDVAEARLERNGTISVVRKSAGRGNA